MVEMEGLTGLEEVRHLGTDGLYNMTCLGRKERFLGLKEPEAEMKVNL